MMKFWDSFPIASLFHCQKKKSKSHEKWPPNTSKDWLTWPPMVMSKNTTGLEGFDAILGLEILPSGSNPVTNRLCLQYANESGQTANVFVERSNSPVADKFWPSYTGRNEHVTTRSRQKVCPSHAPVDFTKTRGITAKSCRQSSNSPRSSSNRSIEPVVPAQRGFLRHFCVVIATKSTNKMQCNVGPSPVLVLGPWPSEATPAWFWELYL